MAEGARSIRSVSLSVSALLQDHRLYYVLAYIFLWTVQSLIIKASVHDTSESVDPDSSSASESEYPYEVLAVTMLTEIFKLLVACCLYANEKSPLSARGKIDALIGSFSTGLYFSIPAAIYLVYNGLSFINLKLLEPATYRVLINSRIVFSGLLLQYFFRIQLSRRQWSGLLLLLAACVVEQSGSFSIQGGVMAIFMMGVQGVCSSLGGVYFQWLLQKPGASDIGLWIKNIYLYAFSIVFNMFAIAAFRPSILWPATFFQGMDLTVLPIVITSGLGGVCTSLLLRHLDVLMKEYANFAEMVIIAIAQHVLFGVPIRITLFVAIILVSYSLYLYKVQPSEPESGKLEPTQEDEDFNWDVEALLRDDEKKPMEKIGAVERRNSTSLTD